MIARAATAVALLLAAPGLARAAHGRLGFTATAGGGWASDAFIGAGLGPDGVAEVTPAARFDLSLAPALKLAAAAGLSYGRYVSSTFTSVTESGGVEARWLPGGDWELSLELGGEHAGYSLGAPLDPGLVTSPSVSRTSAFQAIPLARLRAAGLEWRAGAYVSTRSSSTSQGAVPETDRAFVVGALWPVTPRVAVSVSYKLASNDSPRTDFTLLAHAGFVEIVAHLPARAELEAQLQVQTAKFASASREDLARLTASLARPITESVDWLLTYSVAGNVSNDPSRPSASRHLAFVGARARFGALEW